MPPLSARSKQCIDEIIHCPALHLHPNRAMKSSSHNWRPVIERKSCHCWCDMHRRFVDLPLRRSITPPRRKLFRMCSSLCGVAPAHLMLAAATFAVGFLQFLVTESQTSFAAAAAAPNSRLQERMLT